METTIKSRAPTAAEEQSDRMNTEPDRTTYERCHFTCVYCGFYGRGFDAWMQLSIDHVRPRSCGGTDEPPNRIVACGSCNSITGRMHFTPEMMREEILNMKRAYVAESRRGFYNEWITRVAPRYLDRPLSPIEPFSPVQ